MFSSSFLLKNFFQNWYYRDLQNRLCWHYCNKTNCWMQKYYKIFRLNSKFQFLYIYIQKPNSWKAKTEFESFSFFYDKKLCQETEDYKKTEAKNSVFFLLFFLFFVLNLCAEIIQGENLEGLKDFLSVCPFFSQFLSNIEEKSYTRKLVPSLPVMRELYRLYFASEKMKD